MKGHKKLELRVHSHPNDKEEFVTKSNLELFSFHLTKHSHYEDIQLIAKQNPQLRTEVELSILCLKTIATLQYLSEKSSSHLQVAPLS